MLCPLCTRSPDPSALSSTESYASFLREKLRSLFGVLSLVNKRILKQTEMEAAGQISLEYDIKQGGRKAVHFGSCQEGDRMNSTCLAMEVGNQLQGPQGSFTGTRRKPRVAEQLCSGFWLLSERKRDRKEGK